MEKTYSILLDSSIICLRMNNEQLYKILMGKHP